MNSEIDPTIPVENKADTAILAEQKAAHLDHQVRRLNQELSSVHRASQLLTGPMPLQQVLEMVVQTVAETVAADAAGLRLLDEESGQLKLAATYNLSAEYISKGPVTAPESSLNMKALAGEVVVVDDMRIDPHFKRYHDDILREGIISSLSIGLLYRNKGIGILRLYNRRLRQFTDEDVSLAQTVAAQSAAAIVNARLYEEALEGERIARQVRLAGAVQRHLIPKKMPQRPGLDFGAAYVPCYDVGGDFYDFIQTPDGRLVFALGDVMGKGVPASLAMAAVRTSLRAYAETCQTVQELVGRVNRMFYDDTAIGEFATLFCAFISADNQSLTYCNCGHNPPILLSGDDARPLDVGGLVLGVERDCYFEVERLELRPNDVLMVYTDGLLEATNFQSDPFGYERIVSSLRESRMHSAETIAKNTLWHMRKFAGLNKRFDDIAMVVIKRLAE